MSEKSKASLDDEIVVRHKDTGEMMRMTMRQAEEITGKDWRIEKIPPDGFRKRRKRPAGWYEKAIKNGEIADPKVGVPERVKTDNEFVVDVPMAKVTAERK